MARRSQLIPWRTAGRVSEQLASGDDVVRETGWVFNNATGDDLTLAQFVASGDDEVPAYLERFGLRSDDNDHKTLIEIGSGIGRMTSAFTREFGTVIACDLDAGFLERCYETVGRFGNIEHLRTCQVEDGRSLNIDDHTADLTFSYITLQHCDAGDALNLTKEAVRVTKPGGKIALNYRGPAGSDAVLVPAGAVVRGLYRVPGVGSLLTKNRSLTRIAWQVSRINPDQVSTLLGDSITDVKVWTNPASRLTSSVGEIHHFDGINAAHWWLIATVT